MQDERDASELLNVGKQCSQPLCGLVDFLPFKCQHCNESFCQEHFKVEAHSCKDYDETKFNRVAPNCPLCNTPIAIRPGVDPNIRMDQHLETECYVMTGRSQKTSAKPRCAHKTCHKVLLQPIRCDKCNQQFCPTHRFPGDHICNSQPPKAAQRAGGLSHTSNLLAKFDGSAKKLLQTTRTPTTMKPLPSAPAANPSSSATTATVSVPSTSKSKSSLPFNKTDHLYSVSASSTSHVMPAASKPATTNSTIDNPTKPNLDSPLNKPPSLFNVSSFIPPPLFASA